MKSCHFCNNTLHDVPYTDESEVINGSNIITVNMLNVITLVHCTTPSCLEDAFNLAKEVTSRSNEYQKTNRGTKQSVAHYNALESLKPNPKFIEASALLRRQDMMVKCFSVLMPSPIN